MFEIYSKPGCTYCDQAKALLESKGLPFNEHILDVGQLKKDGVSYYTVNQLQQLVPGAKTVPQIFESLAGTPELIGGYDALKKYLS